MQTQPLTLEESIAQVMHTLPRVVRNYIAQEMFTPVTRRLVIKYKLHADQGGVLEREIMLMLTGIDSPADFMQALAEEARIEPVVIKNIMQEVNEQIFMPLRDEMRNAGMNPAQPAQVRPVQTAPPILRQGYEGQAAPRPTQAWAPLPSYSAPPLQSPRYSPRAGNLAEANIAPLPPEVSMPGLRSFNGAGPQEAVVHAAAPQVQAHAPHMDMLPVGEEPQTAPVPSQIPQPAPQQSLRDVVASVAPQANTQSIPAPAPVQQPVAPPATAPYQGDPYREPIDLT